MKLQRKTLNTLKKTVNVLDELGNAIESVDEVTHEEVDGEMYDIPKKRSHGINLKDIPEYRKIRKEYKISNDKSIFIKDLQSVLDHLPPDDNQYSTEILLMILNVSEQFFCYGDSSTRVKAKDETVQALMLPYFGDDKRLLLTVVALVRNRVRRSTPLTRTLRRVRNFFF